MMDNLNRTSTEEQGHVLIHADRNGQNISSTVYGHAKPQKSTNKCLNYIIVVKIIWLSCLTGLVVGLYQQEPRVELQQTTTPIVTQPRFEALGGNSENLTELGDGINTHKDAYRLHRAGKSWESAHYTQNTNRYSKPVVDKLCVNFTMEGIFDVYSKITLTYVNALSIYHTLSIYRATAPEVGPLIQTIEKNNFQWSPPQTGRLPSTLQTSDPVTARPGDLICVGTERIEDIYISRSDNYLSIKLINSFPDE